MNILSSKKIIIALVVVVLLGWAFKDRFTCQSRADSNYSSFKVCVKRLLGKDNPPPAPLVREEITIRIIEGWNLKDMARYFAAEGLWPEEEFLAATKPESFLVPKANNTSISETTNEEVADNNDSETINLLERFEFLADKPTTVDLEGYLYPDTYRIFADASPQEVIMKMLENFDRKLTIEMRQEIEEQGETIYQVLTMASLLEKEAPINYTTGNNQEAKVIADIFWRRINNRQALESCATLAYILGVNKPQYSFEDTRVESPYNTYINLGLPPGPIASPGILAIEAAIYPTKNNYNYFLTPTGTKDIVYAVTYNEHLQNKAKYLK